MCSGPAELDGGSGAASILNVSLVVMVKQEFVGYCWRIVLESDCAGVRGEWVQNAVTVQWQSYKFLSPSFHSTI